MSDEDKKEPQPEPEPDPRDIVKPVFPPDEKPPKDEE